MNSKSNSSLKLIAGFVVMFFVVIASSAWLTGYRLDLSENGLYSLSDGTHSILSNLENDVTLDFYFSNKATSQLPALRTYAKRVQELLEEYESLSDGKISLKVIDPVPFSEAEDEAALAGLQAVPGGSNGDDIYFGLVAKNSADAEEVIPFVQPSKEAFLEYDLTRLISSLARTSVPKIGVYSSIDIKGGYDYMARQARPEWAVVQYITEGFEIEWIEDDASAIEGVDALLLVGPKDLPDSLLLAIDQYVLSGGRALVFLDPHMESLSGMSGMPSVQRSDLSVLMSSWGVELAEDKFITDFENSMVVSVGQGQPPVRHIGLLSLTNEALSQDDVALFGLDSLNFSSVGALQAIEGATTRFSSVIESSTQSQLKDPSVLAEMHDPQQLMSGFAPTGDRYTIAARVRGAATTAFPDGVTIVAEASDSSEEEGVEPVSVRINPTITESDDINVMIVADTDVLSDRLWVQVQNFFGQQIVSPWADNGSMLVNALENLTGQAELISIRSQGRFSRPFGRVDTLQRQAEERFLAQQEVLEEQLMATETRMMDLESVRDEGDGAMFTAEQEAELLKFQEEKLKIRKQLRDVQHQLNQDIENLGTRLKLINILLIPSLICLVSLIVVFRRRASLA